MAKFSSKELEAAVQDLSLCEFFPSDSGSQAALMRLLAKMCPSREALRWLVDTMVNRVGHWHGSSELRGLLCTHYAPADGEEANCSLPGFTPDDAYQKALDAHQQFKAEGWIDRDERGMVGAGEMLRKLLEGPEAGGKA